MKIIPILVPVLALLVGKIFQHTEKFEDAIDHPVEQFSEQILDSYGFDYDFSEDKKDARDEQKDNAVDEKKK